MPTFKTVFDTDKHHIHLEIVIKNHEGKEYSVSGILDTGAPKTEFSDQFLNTTGFLDEVDNNKKIKQGLETQKYGKIVLPCIIICEHRINDLEVFVSRFENSWGIDALIGLDFFRKFTVTVDYEKGLLITEPI